MSKVCVVETCDRKRNARGWCGAHYQRWRATGDARPDEPVRFGRNTAPSATESPTTSDIAWAAGFLEGDGYFGACNRSHKVSVTQVNKEPLEILKRWFGGSIYDKYTGDDRAGRSATWRWAVNGARARGLMMTVFPFMTEEKKTQIRTTLEA